MPVIGSTTLPLASKDHPWDAGGARKRIPERDRGRAFLWRDGPEDVLESYSLPFADMIDGELKAVPKGLEACTAAHGFDAVQGLPDAAKVEIKTKIAAYYAKLDMTPPWETSPAGEARAEVVQDLSFRAIMPVASTFDPDTYTQRCVIATRAGAVGMQLDTKTNRRYREDLNFDAWDHSELDEGQGAPVIRMHGVDPATHPGLKLTPADRAKHVGLDDVIGRTVPGTLVRGDTEHSIDIRWSRAAGDADVIAKCRDGIYGASLGYVPRGRALVTQDPDGIERRTFPDGAMSRELSVVPIGLDRGAGFRNAQEGPMPEPIPVADEAAIRQAKRAAAREAQKVEAKRQSDIRALAFRAKLPPDNQMFRDALAVPEGDDAEPMSVDAFRAKITDFLVERDVQISGVHDAGVHVGRDERDKLYDAITHAITFRNEAALYDMATDKFGAREFAGMRLSEIVQRLYERNTGRRATIDEAMEGAFRDDMGGAQTSSDLKHITENVFTMHLHRGYKPEEATYRKFFAPRTAPDFKEVAEVMIGGDIVPMPLLANGEFAMASMVDSGVHWKVGRFARKTVLDIGLIADDRTDALVRVPAFMGRGVVRLENNMGYGLLTSNPVCARDGKRLFHADHHNVVGNDGYEGSTAVAGPPNLDGINNADVLLGLQTYIDTSYLDLTSRFLIVPKMQKWQAGRIQNGSWVPIEEGKVPYGLTGKEVISNPRLDKVSQLAWYAAVDPGEYESLIYGLRAGFEAPRIKTWTENGRQGVFLSVEHDFAVAVLTWEGLVYNPGTSG